MQRIVNFLEKITTDSAAITLNIFLIAILLLFLCIITVDTNSHFNAIEKRITQLERSTVALSDEIESQSYQLNYSDYKVNQKIKKNSHFIDVIQQKIDELYSIIIDPNYYPVVYFCNDNS